MLAYLLALAAVCPFVGSVSDLVGRRYVALGGALILLIGIIVSSTAKVMNIFIGIYTLFGPRGRGRGRRKRGRQALT